MLFTVRSIFESTTSEYLKIVLEDGKYGVTDCRDNSYIIPLEYENIFLYGPNTFVLYKNGKIGIKRIDTNESDSTFNIVTISECEYDTLDTFCHNLLLSNDNGTRIYFSNTKETKDFTDVTMDDVYFYGCDESNQYIINADSGAVVHQREYNSCSKEVYCFCGNTDNGPVFYDVHNGTYIYPKDNKYVAYMHLFNRPIIINGRNIVNITEEYDGIGVIDSFGNTVIENSYDKINIEIKITATNKDTKIEKTLPVFKKVIEKGSVDDVSNWS